MFMRLLYPNQPHVSDLLALGIVIPPFKEKVPENPLQELHIGTIRSP
ncbi:hypothetical protein VCHA40P242_10587 [Vibrio chagasii]|nr:hypothetical protein VCHA36P164_120116 [Vibrio chagasii]CAH7041001.1 hypothetical protein VCHA40P242_10587 [Vibrio chagasii]